MHMILRRILQLVFVLVGITLVTVIGLVFNRKLGATVVIETVFAIPGTGSAVVFAE